MRASLELGAVGVALLVAACGPGVAGPETEGVTQSVGVSELLGGAPDDVIEVYVVLEGPPAAAVLDPAIPVGHPENVKRARRRIAELEALRDGMRSALLDRGVRIVAELSRLGNAFQVQATRRELERIERWSLVDRIEPVPRLARALKTGLPVVGAPEAWAATPGHQGDGIRLGIIDSGIDYLHAGFGGTGDPNDFANDDHTVIEPGSFPTPRVIGGWDFVGDDYNPDAGSASPAPDPDPLDCDGHGSHVAGIAAGNGVLVDGTPFLGPYEQSFDPSAFRVAPGVAPEASLYALRVFGCDGSTTVLASALERAVDPDMDGDMSDRLDVLNASLGSSYGLQSPFNGQLVKNLTAVGSLLVVAGGNEGATFFVAGGPSTFPQALAVAASVDSQWTTLEVHSPTVVAGDYAAAEGQFTAPLGITGDVSGLLVASEPHHGCEPFTNAADVAGQIALVDRGQCLFVDKMQNAADAGATAAVIVNDDFGDGIFAMAPSDPEDESPIPGIMIRAEDGKKRKGAIGLGIAATLSTDAFEGLGAELVAGLSSRGPSVTGLLKPEVAAPGVTVVSVDVGTGIQASSKNGTSMACPFVAGAATLVREAHPDWTPTEVKAALMNTAVPLANEDGVTYPLTMQGSGRLDVPAAVSGGVTAIANRDDGAVAISFGAVVVDEPWAGTEEVVVTNDSAVAVDYGVSAVQVLPLPGVTASASPASLSLEPGASGTVTLTLSVDPHELGAPGPDAGTPTTQFDLPRHWLDEAEGYLLLDDAAEARSLRLPFHAVVRAAARRTAVDAVGCADGESLDTLTIELEGASAHPMPVTSVFELGALLDEDPESAGDPLTASLDLRAVGVATDSATAEPEDVSLFFGVAVEGPWTTPAQGTYSLVGVQIDTDDDDFPDYAIVAEPLGREPPYADVLASTTYILDGCAGSAGVGGCEATESKRFINMVPADAVASYPYLNSVLVLAAFARDLELVDETSFRYRAYTQGLIGSVDSSAWIAFDHASPRVDAAPFAPTVGRPIFAGVDAIQLALGAPDVDGSRGTALLLHHTNAVDARFETLDLDAFEQRPTSIRHDLPESAPAGALLTRRLHVENEGTHPLREVTLSGEVTGGTLRLAAPEAGSCAGGETIDCALGDIPAGGTVVITLQLDPDTVAEALDVRVEAASASGCLTTETATVALDVSGGCGGRMAGEPQPRGWWWLSLAMATGLWRRRRF
ncbi:MAG: S8 family serine peptidase [Polyangiaceae bacterium]